jgi:hypothetical protein
MAKRVYTPKDIESKKYECFDWDGEWLSAFGNPAMNSRWFVLGPSASGKSSFVMQLAKKLCEYGSTLYMSYEEGVGMEFQRRLKLMKMNEVQGRFIVSPDDTYKELVERLGKPKSPRFVVVDSFQVSEWSYEQALELMKRYPQKGFVFISQEDKGQPIGRAAIRLRYIADMKIRVAGYKAYCQGRSAGSPGNYYIVWKEGVLMTSNNL